jgi:hypothetical protein
MMEPFPKEDRIEWSGGLNIGHTGAGIAPHPGGRAPSLNVAELLPLGLTR